MGSRWEKEELLLIKTLYESGLSLYDTYNEYKKIYSEKRTEGAVWLAIKRNKYRHTKEQTSEIKSLATKGKNNPMYGKQSWCTGLTKETNESLRIRSESLSITRKQMFKDSLIDLKGIKNGMFGKTSWCKGLTKDTNDTVKQIAEKISIFRKKYWESISTEKQNDIIGKLTEGANKKKNNTSIEHIVKKILEDLNVNFIQQYRLSRFVCDFFLIEFNLVIECQGDYWHANPNKKWKMNDTQLFNIERDKKKIAYLEEQSIKYLFLWETDIHKNKDWVINEIKKCTAL